MPIRQQPSPLSSKYQRRWSIFLEQQLSENPQAVFDGFKLATKVLYSDSAFAKLGDPNDMPTTATGEPDMMAIIDRILTLLKSDDMSELDMIMHLHTAFGGTFFTPPGLLEKVDLGAEKQSPRFLN